MQNAKLKLLLDFLPYILGPWLFRVQDVELKKFSGDRAISPKRSSPELPAPLISSGIYLHLQGDVMPFEKENSINNQRSPITIDVLAKRLVRKTANGKGNVFDFFFVHLIYKTYKDHLKAGKVPKFLKFLRKPTLLTESEEDKILWEASDAIDEAARYPKSEVPDEKIDNVKKAINKLCILLEDPRKARDLVGDLTKSDWWNARKPLFFLKGKAIQSLIAFINNLELEPLKDSVVALIPDPQEISQELDEMMVLADLEKKCEENGLNEDATRVYLLTRKHGISLAQACRERGLSPQKYEAIRKTLRRKSLSF